MIERDYVRKEAKVIGSRSIVVQCDIKKTNKKNLVIAGC